MYRLHREGIDLDRTMQLNTSTIRRTDTIKSRMNSNHPYLGEFGSATTKLWNLMARNDDLFRLGVNSPKRKNLTRELNEVIDDVIEEEGKIGALGVATRFMEWYENGNENAYVGVPI